MAPYAWKGIYRLGYEHDILGMKKACNVRVLKAARMTSMDLLVTYRAKVQKRLIARGYYDPGPSPDVGKFTSQNMCSLQAHRSIEVVLVCDRRPVLLQRFPTHPTQFTSELLMTVPNASPSSSKTVLTT
jgi:hypothetical protein